ncbi:MAG: DMT family transporter, partial [Planctomycetota bacterium]
MKKEAFHRERGPYVSGMRTALRTLGLTAICMLAFAGNSLLCRAALEPHSEGPRIDPASFTAIRIGAGALILLPILLRRSAGEAAAVSGGIGRTLLGGALLLTYAFSFAVSYRTVPTGTGALLLFGAVQFTMLGAARLEGERLGARRGAGALLAAGGLLLLFAPSQDSLQSTDAGGAALMALSGVAWGSYTLLGRGRKAPTRATAQNFAAALPVALLLLPFADVRVTGAGVALAAASGAFCSGLGYALWYVALAGHSA